MSKAILFILFAMVAHVAAACDLTWEWSGDPDWVSGFRVYQNGALVGTAPADVRTTDCTSVGLVPEPGPITMTAYWGDEVESEQSDPAAYDIAAPGIRIVISAP